jgi:signal transduction histidine kinase
VKISTIYLNQFFFIFIAGAILLAAIYHTILYSHRKTKLLSSYSGYLWCTFLYCFYRVFFPDHDPEFVTSIAPDTTLDESLQMVIYLMYVRFIGIALNLKKDTDGQAYVFVKLTPVVIAGYVLLQYILIVFKTPFVIATMVAVVIRIYLLFLGFTMLIKVLKKRDRLYYNYLSAGAISMIFFGLLSSAASFMPGGTIVLGAATLLLLGFFFDVIFFSAAIGYNIREEALEKENALKLILQQQQELQLKELEKKEAIYQTQLQERFRMSKDLHDDIGATLSSISMYSDTIKNQVKEKLPHLENVLNKMGENSRDMVTSMSDIIWAINPDNDDANKLVSRMEAYARDICSLKDMQLHFKTAGTFSYIKLQVEQRKNTYLIFKEAVNNAAKYAGAKNIWVQLSLNNTEINLLIKDDGNGFNEETVRKGNGLKNFEARSKEINGNIAIDSKGGNGTTVSLRFSI